MRYTCIVLQLSYSEAYMRTFICKDTHSNVNAVSVVRDMIAVRALSAVSAVS